MKFCHINMVFSGIGLFVLFIVSGDHTYISAITVSSIIVNYLIEIIGRLDKLLEKKENE